MSDFGRSHLLRPKSSYQPRIAPEKRPIGVSRDTIASLRNAALIASGPRSPTPGAPCTYVTTKHLLSAFGMVALRDLQDISVLEEAGLLSRAAVQEEVLAGEGE